MEKIIREIERRRERVTIIHEYTTLPLVLHRKTNLASHLADMFTNGVPERPKTVTGLPRLITQWEEVDSPWIEYAKKSGFRGFGNAQHRIVQDYFWENIPHVIGTETPVYDDEATGMMDILIATPEILFILDVKPDIQKCVDAAMSQLFRYRAMLIKNARVDRRIIQCYAFDDKKCYKLTS